MRETHARAVVPELHTLAQKVIEIKNIKDRIKDSLQKSIVTLRDQLKQKKTEVDVLEKNVKDLNKKLKTFEDMEDARKASAAFQMDGN